MLIHCSVWINISKLFLCMLIERGADPQSFDMKETIKIDLPNIYLVPIYSDNLFHFKKVSVSYLQSFPAMH